ACTGVASSKPIYDMASRMCSFKLNSVNFMYVNIYNAKISLLLLSTINHLNNILMNSLPQL
ncbi:MAG: hypothetical protein ACQERU_08495, partial [Bacteroidota bacterium]